MIPYSVVQSYSALRSSITDAGLAELDELLASLTGEPTKVQREALKELIPELGDQYINATSLSSAQFFEELMEIQDVKTPRAPELVPLPERKRWQSLVDWSADDYVFQHLGPNMVYSRLAGGITKQLTEAASDTMIGNAQLLDAAMSAQRVPKPGCCAFCSMLASRGAVYSTKSAGQVVGRGKPVGSHSLAKGVRPRGSRALGEKFHDFCRCEVVPVTPDNYVELQSIEKKHLDAYINASKNSNDGRSLRWKETRLKDGSLKKKHYWVKDGKHHTAADKTSDILAAMRAELGIK